MIERKPSAKALLELAAGEGRGKLKVFLGMAPGVGKTYAMLSNARALKAEGVDVVVGVVETHGRGETAALLDGLEVLPRRTVLYRNRTLMEFDVDAAIARRPALLLVDEFAHTNAPGVVHEKRYQDVEGVLQAGINVWTTLNIQHLESLNDVVQRITGVTVTETVPDRVLERADEIVVVDLPPEELIKRLKEGKVYLPDNARRAVDRFFKPGNLTALRELALRRTADRVDEQMIAELRRQGIEGPWPSAERLLVCVGGDETAEATVRAASRIAQAQKCDWVALNLRISNREITDRNVSKRSDRAMRLAERLGASTVRLAAQDLVQELLAYAMRNNITQIVVGKSKGSSQPFRLKRSLSDELLSRARGLAITVVTPEAEPGRKRLISWPPREAALSNFAIATGAVAVATAVGALTERVSNLPNLSMFFLLAVLLCAARYGVWAATYASFLSFLAYNFFFLSPRYTFTIAQPHELLSLFIFLIVAVATGSLAGRLHDQADATRERSEMMEALFEFSRKLSAAVTRKDVAELLALQCAAAAKGRSAVLVKQDGDLELKSGSPDVPALTTSDWTAARWAHVKLEKAGRFTGTLPTAQFQFLPLTSRSGSLGVVGVAPDTTEDALPSTVESALRSFVDQASLAMERIALVEDAQRAEKDAEAEKLRSALLSSVSHDLKTPLASIVGSVSSLRELGDRMPKATQTDLLATIEEETARLRCFVENLLDMTRLEAGALDIAKDSVDVGEVVRLAVGRAERSFPKRKVAIEITESLPPVRGDAALLGQVLFNLLDNANKYSDANSVTRVMVALDRKNVTVAVSDQGIGIPREDLARVFEKFYRVAQGDGRAAGTGLGLSIASGLIKAMGGIIRAESPIVAGKGTRIVVTLPAAVPNRRYARDQHMTGLTPASVLAVDDEPQILRFLRPSLEAAGYRVLTASNGAEAIHTVATAAPDAVLLDLGLPDMDGKDVITRLRSWSQVPIIVLSARDREAEKIAAFDLGANDYVEKPFGIGELLARLRAILRHAALEARPADRLETQGLSVDIGSHTANLDGAPLKLTPKEFELLVLLLRSAGRVLTHKQILTAVWGPAHGQDVQYLRVLVGQLRQKLKREDRSEEFIVTEPGIGYRLRSQ